MTPEDICLVFRFSNEESIVDRFIQNNMKFCRCFVALDDRSDSSSLFQSLLHHPKCASIARKHQIMSYQENADRSYLYNMAVATGVKYILSLDVDEILERNFLEEMLKIESAVQLVTFAAYFMYPDDNHYITEGVYQPRRGYYLFSANPNLCFSMGSLGLHIARFPACGINQTYDRLPFFDNVYNASSKIYHYNMSDEARRRRRFELYTKLDPNNAAQGMGYRHIITEHTYAPIKANIE